MNAKARAAWFYSPPAAVCPSCRRMVVRTDGHRCNVLRDYERTAKR